MNCPYCNKEMKIVPDSEVYGRSYGGSLIYCRTCDAYAKVNRGVVLGFPARKALRSVRKSIGDVLAGLNPPAIGQGALQRGHKKLFSLVDEYCRHSGDLNGWRGVSFLKDHQGMEVLRIVKDYAVATGQRVATPARVDYSKWIEVKEVPVFL